MSDQLDSYGMNAKQNLGTKIKYRCTQVRIWCGQDDKKVWFQNKLVNIVGGQEFALIINSEQQDFRPGREYWIEIVAAE